MGLGAQSLAPSSIALGKASKVTEQAEKGISIGDKAITNHADSVALGSNSITTKGATAATYKAPIGNNKTASFDKSSIGTISIGNENNLRQITHVAAGVDETDAVNVWQLNKAIAALKEAIENNPTENSHSTTTNNSPTKYFHANGENAIPHTPAENRTNGDSSAAGKFAVAIGHLADATATNSVAVGNSTKSTVENSVALGNDSVTTSAKTENTLGVGNQRDKDIIEKLNDAVNLYAGNAVGVVSVGDKGKERLVQNVAAGLVSATSTDAVNGSQLHALAQAMNQGQTGLIRQGADPANIKDGVNHNRLTVGAATGGQEINFANINGENRRLTGVADAVNTYDAVNKGQLDKAIASVNNRIAQTEKRLKGGIANAIAMATLTQASLPSQNMLSVGTGYYRGSSSVAVGLSQVSDDGRVTFKVNGSVSQQGDVAAGAAIGFAW